MSDPNPRRFRWRAAAILFCMVAGLALLLRGRHEPWQDTLGQASYDSLHRWHGQFWLTSSPVVVVYLDLPSYQQHGLDPLKPWPRALHAQLLQRLTSDGARASVFDIVFSGPGTDPEGDAAFAKAIAQNGRVVLAAECNFDAGRVTGDDGVRAFRHSITPPLGEFAKAAAGVGLAIQAIDRDYTIRRYVAGFSESEVSLSWAAARLLHLDHADQPGEWRDVNHRWLRYYGPASSIPHVRFSEALEPGGVPEHFFRDKIVLIGARPWIEQFHERQDEFVNPYHSSSQALFMPGVEVHATELLNLVRGDFLDRLDGRIEDLLLVAIAAVFGGGLIWLRPLPATFVAFTGATLVLVFAVYGFSRGVWVPWMLISAVEIPCAWAGSIVANSVDWYRTRKRFEHAKRIAEAKIREQAALIEKANDAILVQDLGGLILYANPRAQRLYGWTAEDLPADSGFATLWLDPEVAGHAREDVLKLGEWNGELRHQTRDGRMIVVASRWTLIRDDAGEPKSILIISTDITEQKDLEVQLLRIQRLNTIGSLAGGMAHDLNNALAPILMGVQLLRRKSTEGETRDLLSLIETSTHRGADMVRQVLLFARGREGDFERLQLGPVLREVEKLVHDTFPKTIIADSFLPDDLWPVLGNSTQLHQILLNLSVNARDAMPHGGRLSFMADNAELDSSEASRIRDGTPGKFVCVSVSDTGTGMPPEVQEKIFEPFFTTKPIGQGTGIGLTAVLRLVKAHRGFVRVQSEPGQGTTFDVFLPASPEAAVVTAAPKQSVLRGKGELILLADDEQAVRDLLRAELISSGYRVLVAENGRQAVEIFQQNANDICMFITDGSMPILNGLEAMAIIRALKSDLPVIVTSGELNNAMPNVAVLSKPFSFEQILAVIQQQMVSSKSAPT